MPRVRNEMRHRAFYSQLDQDVWRRTMADDLTKGVRSRASIMGHPIHPMIVPFPIAFLVGTLVSDIVFASNGDPFWAIMSKWLIVAALVMGAVAAVLGLTDFVG